ncbi:general secretion pathway protein I [Klebsiella pneumoniae]|nr:general secretion pathway protein I [Klebsiella pneumoniae]
MKREAGMTLIEVMVALVIFALAGLAVMQSTLQQTRQLGRMEEKILASWLADNQLVQLRLEKRWPASAGLKPPWRPPGRAGLSAGREWKPRCRSCGRWTWRSGGKKAIPRRWPPCAPG